MNAVAHLPVAPSRRRLSITFDGFDLAAYLPEELRGIDLEQTTIPGIAKNPILLGEIESCVQTVPTRHMLIHGDAREMEDVTPNSVHLVVTSPPYWTLKRYEDSSAQMGHIEDYETFLIELATVWQRCYEALVPGEACLRCRRCVPFAAPE